MEKNKKLMATLAVTLSTISAVTFVGYSFSQVLIDKASTSITDNIEIGWTRDDEKNNENRYLKNALEQDAQEKAMTDTVLFYKISTIGVITRFSVVAHIMRILELNPNKIIRIYVVDSINLDPEYFNNKDKFPNVQFKYFEKTDLESSIDNFAKYNYNIQFLEEVYEEFGPNQKIDGYFDDYSFAQKIILYVNGLNTPINRLKIYNEFSLLSKLESMSFISDGTWSVEFFKQQLKQAFLLADNLYDSETQTYANAMLMKDRMKNDDITKEEFLQGNNALLYLTSLITFDREKVNSSKYFLPTTDFIGEMNRLGSKNYKHGADDIFSPYNAQNLDVMSMIKKLDQEAIRQILKIDQGFDPEIYIAEMNNHNNYVYAGSLMANLENAISNGKTLLAIKKYAIATTPEVSEQEKIVVWFKGHPRDNDILQKLVDAVKRITNGTDDGSWIRVLDHKVPFEFYSVANVFVSDPEANKKVFLFTTYSTLVLTNYAEEPRAEIAKIIVDNSSLYSYQTIVDIYGENSKIFPEDKLTTLKDFEESYS
ncbi:MAG: hypothetical protein ACRDCH_03185 [Metamycoplasmataceae bacterium]